MSRIRQFVPGQYYQGVDEEKAYTIDIANWFTAATMASAVIFEGTTNRSASNFSSGAGSTGATISACTVTTPCLVALRAGVDYRVEVLVQSGGEKLEGFFTVTGE